MGKLTVEIEKIMTERFAKDSVIALATVEDGIPYVRNVNGFYENGAFFVITHTLSNKMRQIEKNPAVAISGEWFTAHGRGTNLGYFCSNENFGIARKLKEVFAEWIDNGHNDFDDVNTCILCIRLTDGILFSNGKRFEIDFSDRMPVVPNDGDFWRAIDQLVSSSKIVIDRPKGTAHPKFPDFIYQVDYGYLENTSSMDHDGIDVWVGTDEKRNADAVMCIVDLNKRDSEIKILVGCSEQEKEIIYQTHNETKYMKGILIRRA